MGEKGGEIAVNLWVAHRWNEPGTVSGAAGDFDYVSCRLSPIENTDHWWKIFSEADVRTFAASLDSLLNERGKPWYEKVATKEGFLSWYRSVYPTSYLFPQILEVYGASELRNEVSEWLGGAPRGIEATLDWLVKAEVISADLSSRLRLASLQAAEEYRDRLPELIRSLNEPPFGKQSTT